MSFLKALAGKEVLIFGAGVTGKSVANFLEVNGARTILVDEKLPQKAAAHEKIRSDLSGLELSNATLAVTSPGWRRDHPLINKVRDAGVELISEIDLAWRVKCEQSPEQRWLALTGTNGKTTTVQMAEAILQKSGFRARACGNVGDPVIEHVTNSEFDVLILELSSFQLAWSEEAKFVASAILNLAEDHIDWHGNFSAYAAAKFKISNMSEVLIVNQDDKEIQSRLVGVKTKILSYTLGSPKPHQIGLVENLIIDRAFVSGDAEVLFELGDVKPSVPHNVSNAMAAAALARAIGAEASAVATALSEFKLDHHRLETVLEADGVTWIDDSKATNPHAALAALRSQIKSIWIAGGLAKGSSMEVLVKEGAARIKFAILIGTDAPLIAQALREFAPEIEFVILDQKLSGMDLMREVVKLARSKATSGDCVLLAPACASMDQFANYAQRGEHFAAAVKEVTDAK